MRIYVAAVAAVAIAACTPVDVASLPSNTFTFAKSKSATKDAFVPKFLARGYDIKSDSDYQIVFEKKSNGLAAGILFGSRYDSTPAARITTTIVGSSPTTVTGKASIVTNPGSAFERVTDVSNNPEARGVFADLMTQAGGKPIQ